MKAVITGIVAAAALATVAAVVLNFGVQHGVEERYVTTGVRL